MGALLLNSTDLLPGPRLFISNPVIWLRGGYSKCVLNLVRGGSGGAELTFFDLPHGLSASMVSGIEGADNFFGGRKGVKRSFLGVKSGWKIFTASRAQDEFLDPPRRADSKNTIFICSEIWVPGPLAAPCWFGFAGAAFRKIINCQRPPHPPPPHHMHP